MIENRCLTLRIWLSGFSRLKPFLAPEANALPGCATRRTETLLYSIWRLITPEILHIIIKKHAISSIITKHGREKHGKTFCLFFRQLSFFHWLKDTALSANKPRFLSASFKIDIGFQQQDMEAIL